MMVRISVVSAIAAASLLAAEPLPAQPDSFQMEEIRVYTATQIIGSANHSIAEGERLQFNVRPQALRNWPRRGVQARLFRLPEDGNQPVRLYEIDNCWVYDSAVSGAIRRGPAETELWSFRGRDAITLGHHGASNARYLVVFEEIVHRNRFFRIYGRNNRDRYFGSGWRIEIRAVGRSLSLAEALRQRADRAARLADAEARAVRGQTCFNNIVRQVEAPGSHDRYAQVEICLGRNDRPGRRSGA